MKRPLGLVMAILLSMFFVACGDDDSQPVECDPPCDTDACEECVNGECMSYCEGDQVCDGAGNCVDPSEVCDPPCDTDACEECVNGECVSYCEGDQVCDGAGNCVDPSEVCDPPCDTDACEECVEGDCVSYCDFDQECDGEGNCVELGPSGIGGPCIDDEHCSDEGAICLNELLSGLPGGYCTMDCYSAECPAGSECVPAGSVELCMPLCTPGEEECRTGYECVDLDTIGVCWGACDNNSQCSWTGYCDTESGFCDCPEGTHVDEDALDCVYNDCDYLSCEDLNQSCDPTGGCEGDCAACDGCDPADYVESDNHCYPSDAYWGGPCEKHADCPGTGMPGEDTFCQPYTGGFCEQVNGPDFVADGEPCAGDPGSVGYIEDYGSSGSFNICAQSCEINDDCRPGYHCDVAPMNDQEILICQRITDCNTTGCNDPDENLYCGDTGQCWVDGCATDPCASVDNSTGECINSGDNYVCLCNEDYAWDDETKTCEPFNCDDTEVAENSVTNGNNCGGTEVYNAAGSGTSCTGYSTNGPEVVYSLEVPASSMVFVELNDGENYDASLWVTTSCGDMDGMLCVAGADDPEELYIINSSDTAVTYYIIADAYSGCGDFTLTVGEFEAAPVCGNGILEAGEECDNGDSAGDGCSLSCEVEFGWECEGEIGDESVCVEMELTELGAFGAEDAIPDQTGGPLQSGDSDFYMIEFTEDVVFSGTLTGDDDVDFIMHNESMVTVISLKTAGDEEWNDETLPAGLYLMEVNAWNATNSYTLSMSTN